MNLSNYDTELSLDFLDVTFDNIKFRISVGQTGEIAILKLNKTNRGLIKFLDNDESQTAHKKMIAKPLFASLVKGLQQDHPIFGLAVRLVKKWLETQMISLYFEEEAIELIVAHIFRLKYRFSPPNSSRVAFLRFLDLVASFDWKTSGLVVDIDGSLSNMDMEEMSREIKKSRKNLPRLVLSWIGDEKGAIFTKSTPDVIVRHLIALAKKGLEVLTSTNNSIEVLFRPDLSIFDILLNVKKSVTNEIISKFVERLNVSKLKV